ncbi:MAG: hypothetical protein M3Q08_10085 [Pseudomonadota bacterium]|nr:hypothetical protein [Pseudomonadota bacterium]
MPARLTKPLAVRARYILSPQFSDFTDNPDIARALFQHFANLLTELHGLTLDSEEFGLFPSPGKISLQVSAFSRGDFEYIARSNPFPELFLDSQALEFVGEWSDPQAIADYNRANGVIHKKRVVEYTCATYLHSVARKLLVLMSIFLPGSSKSIYSYTDADYGIESPHGCVSHFALVAIALQEAGIDPVPGCSFTEVIDWSLSQPGYWHGLPHSNIGRALNLFSHAHHLHHQLSTLHDMAWIVAAVETLLAESAVEIRARIARRFALICPDVAQKFSRKRLLAAYDFRSRFLHGDINVPNHFAFGPSNYRKEFAAAEEMLVLILVKVLQTLASSASPSLPLRRA